MQDFLFILQLVIHYSFHFIFPGLVARIFFRKNWIIAWVIMVATMIVDLDHLIVDPIFDPNRCSIGFHPLHSYYAITIYLLMFFVPNIYVKIMAVGLLLHMFTDFQDCLWISFFG